MEEEEMKTIDLDEIIKSYETHVVISQPHNTEPIFLKESIKEMLMDFGKQLLELAAENADCTDVGVGAEYFYKVDKQSILDTIKQIK
jgi:hypothetical protein